MTVAGGGVAGSVQERDYTMARQTACPACRQNVGTVGGQRSHRRELYMANGGLDQTRPRL